MEREEPVRIVRHRGKPPQPAEVTLARQRPKGLDASQFDAALPLPLENESSNLRYNSTKGVGSKRVGHQYLSSERCMIHVRVLREQIRGFHPELHQIQTSDSGEVAPTRAQWTAGTNEQELLTSEAAHGKRTVRLLSHQESAETPQQSPAAVAEGVKYQVTRR